ncbi:MAG: exodeoxyribonuclease VII large subunit [Betaproteobacteria bacterium]|nr:exodeoxyribonuclease VII large subunit [Betaproteobacteria bacterium]
MEINEGAVSTTDPAGTHAFDAATPVVARAPVVPVSLLVSSARLLLERQIGLIWVSGEIGNYTRAASGHCYFNLKDAHAQVRCVLFRLRAQHVAFALRDGLAIEVRATPSIYEARGEFQLNVETIRLAGLGALYERFMQLKAKLDAAGWFAPSRKRALPSYPHIIGIVTSTRAAALRDILTTLKHRWPSARVVIYPAAVQGEGAAIDLARAIRLANARREADVLIVARGGGSIEDLWAFNEEIVARAVYESVLPIVAGVGHETDFTICDFVADVRAPTPTAAAAAATPDRAAIRQRAAQLARRTIRAGDHALAARVQRVDAATRRLIHPAARLQAQLELARDLARRLGLAWRRQMLTRSGLVAMFQARLLRELRAPSPHALRLQHAGGMLHRLARAPSDRAGARLRALAQNLAHLSPHAVLLRGYSIITLPDGSVVMAATQLHRGAAIGMRFGRGHATANVTDVE